MTDDRVAFFAENGQVTIDRITDRPWVDEGRQALVDTYTAEHP